MEDGGGGADGGFSRNSSFGTFPETAMDLDFMEELLFDGCWVETTDGKGFKQPGPSASTSSAMNDSSFLFGYPESRIGHFGVDPSQNISEEETEKKSPPSTSYLKIQELETQLLTNQESPDDQLAAIISEQQEEFLLEGAELGKSWWIAPRGSPGPCSSVKDRLLRAIWYVQEAMRDKDFLVQLWVPYQKGGKNFLTTVQQPHLVNSNYLSLRRYRCVSENYSFPAEEGTKESLGLPGRVYLKKLPEWTPDVRFFRSEEYPRIKFAQEYNVCGSLALPVFERGSGTCLGVVEIVTTTQKINYRPELENICKALEAIDLRSSSIMNPPHVEFLQVYNEFYQAASPEISEFLASVCRSYDLPLALTWAPCARQGKGGSRHSDDNYSQCVSTIDSACFVPDDQSKNFLEACSEHHLLQGEGIVGRAFKTNKQCFATDVTAFSKTNYSLAHHAKIFGLHAALAVPLKSKFTGMVELVLELFFPKACLDTEGQRQILNSLSTTMQREFRSLNLVMDKELEEEVILPVRETMVFSENPLSCEEADQKLKSSSFKEISPEESSWISHMMEANQKGKGVSLSWEYQKEEPKEEFKLTAGWDNSQLDPDHPNFLSGLGQFQQGPSSGPRSNNDPGGESATSGGRQTSSGRRPGEKRRTKNEKTIGLEVLRQYFAGSLKDAAKSIGVCPTTLKRICRQHGITRWPSRKIKKVGHSLKKLQLVIDSVQGVEGSIQLGSFYTSFPELSSQNTSGGGPSLKLNEQSTQLNYQTENGVANQGTEAPKSPSSSCSQSSGSSTCCSTGANKISTSANVSNSENALVAKNSDALLKRACSEAELHIVNQEEKKGLSRTQSHKTFNEYPLLETESPHPGSSSKNLKAGSGVKVKATFAEAKVRFSLPPNWGFRELKQEIARRFSIDDSSKFDLKYLDDDQEWVLLTCDADLEECTDIYRASHSRTIKITVHEAAQSRLGSSFGSSAPT